MNEHIHIISLGAGVQSSTMALMAAHGEITPMPVAAIFADTQAEPANVYRWLDWLEKQLPFPVHRVTRGDLDAAVSIPTKATRKGSSGRWYQKASIPAYIGNGTMRRECTTQYKINPLRKEWNRLLKNTKANGVQWIGISADEAHRAKDCRFNRVVNRFPLLEIHASRAWCFEWMKSKGYPEPPKSACYFCPYRDNAGWHKMKTEEPESSGYAVEFEKALQSLCSFLEIGKDKPFLHRSLVPLSDADFLAKVGQEQLDMFGNECEGMCGV